MTNQPDRPKFQQATPWRKPNLAPWGTPERPATRTLEIEPRGGGSFMYDNADSIAYRGECEHCHKPGPDHEPCEPGDGWFYRFEWGYVCPDCAPLIESAWDKFQRTRK